MWKYENRPVEFEEFWIKLQSQKFADWLKEDLNARDVDSFVDDVLDYLDYKEGVFGLEKGEIEDLIATCWHQNFDPAWQANAFSRWD